MKIALIAYLHGSGGAERQIIMLANALAERGNKVHLAVVAAYDNRYSISEKVAVHDLTYAESKRGPAIFNRYKALKKTYSEITPDITIHYNFQSAYLSVAMPRKIRGTVVYSERGDPYDKEYGGLLGVIRKIAIRKIDGFVFQSEGARDYFSAKIRKRAVVIHNSVSVSQDKYPMPEFRDNRIVNVGRLHPQKNQSLLIDAFAQIASEFPGIVLEIYGDGYLKDSLQKQIELLDLQNRVFLLPSRTDIFKCIRTAALFVLTSDYEGMPNALMEAMALGVPCISTDCHPGGARSIVKDGENGFIVPVKNVGALAQKMRCVLANPNVAVNIARNGRKLGVTHTQEKIFDQWNEYLMTR